jgi:hypothetical protein
MAMIDGTFESLLDREFHWPKPGDKLFVRPTESSQAVALARLPWERLVLMADGYRKAADLLVARASEKHYLRATLIYPILFLYRHFIELELKYVLTTYGRAAGQKSDWENHDLDILWPKVRAVIDCFSLETEKETASIVEACIAEMAKIDPGSFTFRYPVTKKGQPMSLDFDSVDLANLQLTMEKISNFFDGVDGALDDRISI